MCYNCGCQKPDDDMGNSKNITNKTLKKRQAHRVKNPTKPKKMFYN